MTMSLFCRKARAACAAAFAEFLVEAEADEVRVFEVALRDEPERPPAAAPCRKPCGRVLRGHAHERSHDN